MIDSLKKQMREKFKLKRRELTAKFAKEESFKICTNLENFSLLKVYFLICAFYPIDGEPDILPFLQSSLISGKKIFLPKYSPQSGFYEMTEVANFAGALCRGKFGIMEPYDGEKLSETLDIVWLIPGLAFSPDGDRLGFGGGSYDKLLSKFSGLKIGVCFDMQVIDSIPSGDHDVKMDYVLTDKKIYKCNKIQETSL